MMVSFVKDTKRFWREREQSRIALDVKRANAPPSEKKRIRAHIRSDIRFLRTGRLLSKP